MATKKTNHRSSAKDKTTTLSKKYSKPELARYGKIKFGARAGTEAPAKVSG